MPVLALFTAVEIDQFMDSQECTSRGLGVQASQKRQKNDNIAEGAAIRTRIMGKTNIARATG